jgi:hypothetical protein
MPTPGDQQNEFDDITGRLRDERQQLSGLELDGLKSRVMARAQGRGSRLQRWTGSARWTAVGLGLALAAFATGGTIAAVGGSGGGGFAGVAQNAACSQYASQINFRFDYGTLTSSGAFSGTTDWSPTAGVSGCSGNVTIGPSAKQDSLTWTVGQTVYLGYDLKVPGLGSPLTVTVNSPTWTLYWSCPKGVTPHPASTTVTGPSGVYTFSDSNWHPDSSQSGGPYQYQTTAPAACGGQPAGLSNGVLFTAKVTAS